MVAAISAVVSIAALVIALAGFTAELGSIQHSRELSGRDTCYLLRLTVFAATPPGRHGLAVRFLDNRHNPLHDCDAYGEKVRHLGIK